MTKQHRWGTSMLIATGMATPCLVATPSTLYSIGEPTAKEQLYIEFINRARANPTAEGIWLNSLNNSTLHPNIHTAYDYFNVNLPLMQNEFVTGSSNGKPILNVTPPLAPNSKLAAAAAAHSQNQIDLDFQGHYGNNDQANGGHAGNRISAQGYSYSAWGENTFVASYNVHYGHAGFQVDWGGTDGTGMQGPPRGHRSATHSPSYREIGLANLTSAETTIPASNTQAKGPEVCTQVFARGSANTPFITGVAYYDLNSNNFYDIGEGVGGVTVNVAGSAYYSITSTSGGYAVPVPSNGNYGVTFVPTYSSGFTTTENVTEMNNLKKDLLLTYTPPSITGSSIMALHDLNQLEASTVLGVASYTWRWGTIISNPITENADQGSSGYSLVIGNNYSAAQTTTSFSGNTFRLVDAPQGGSGNGFKDQTLTLERYFSPGNSATLNFKSRVAMMYSGQHCKVQISEDGGSTWLDTSFDQSGDAPGESTFADRSVDLSDSAGKTIKIRFTLDYQSGSIYNIHPDNWVSGWYIDNITFSDIEEIGATTEETVASGNTLNFPPSTSGTYRLSVRANLMGAALPYGPDFDIAVSDTDFSSWLTNNPTATGGNMGDPDLDGISNLVEYAFGLNPALKDALPSPTLTATTFTMSANRPPYAHGDITYEIERSSTLGADSWSIIKTFSAVETLEHVFQTSTGPQYFYRWKITLNP